MKKLITLGSLFLGIVFFAHSQALAQENMFSLGPGITYGTEIEAIGIQGSAVYGFTEQVRGAADLTIFFPDDSNGADHSFWTINANVHYLLLAENGTNIYGLGGLNYATQEFSNGVSVSDSEAGLNLGGGAEVGMEFGAIYLEAKYIISDFDQLVLAGGVRFAF